MRFSLMIAGAVLGVACFAAPTASANPAQDNILRAETQIAALNPADAATAAPADYRTAQLRLDEARAAEEKNQRRESMWRSEEALLHADVVQEKVKLRALQRTVSEIETGLATLRREIK